MVPSRKRQNRRGREAKRELKLDHVHGDFDICPPVQLSRSLGNGEHRAYLL